VCVCLSDWLFDLCDFSFYFIIIIIYIPFQQEERELSHTQKKNRRIHRLRVYIIYDVSVYNNNIYLGVSHKIGFFGEV